MVKEKKRYRIKPFSKKRRCVNREYQKESKKFRQDNPECAIRSPVCIGETQGVHHKKGKASVELLMDKRFWLPSCNPCNTYVEEHDAWARENGFKESKFKDAI
jgi:hypothetical protein